ncbi:putative dual specificity protein phosphatase DSP8 [Selaginella moellendorffii]|uniref:putative dual specificity protein phosphatase DSP8 n=1 Tax=Selaginella moellendorffii TaxID=88036 RepID=UPI000D1C95D6|nr:putative dual specificity protein phosphatase DSP8 [Selaginella moellendorffii]|eukprot:XP_002991389.2 putative dual specificity protein phosphatase DSP8 [Selaginella moellendorffii]
MAIIREESSEESDPTGNGAIVDRFSRAKVIAIAAGARLLFYPTLAYNVLRNSMEDEFRWWDQVDEFLLLGAVPFRSDVILLKSAGVRGVVTLNEPFETLVDSSFYQEHGISHCVIPTRDYYFAPAVKDIRRAVNFIHEHALRGETTYVHCKAGRGRSTTVALCYLMEHRGLNPIDAFNYIRARRPRVLLASAQWEAVYEYRHKYCSRPLLANAGSGSCSSSDDLKPSLPCLCIYCTEEPVMITATDLADYREKPRWMLWKNLGLVLSYLLRMEKMEAIEMACKPAQDFGSSIQLTAY